MNKILNNEEYFEILFVENKEYIQIKTQYIKSNLTNILEDLVDQYNILLYNPNISIELEEQNKIDNNFKFNNIINNRDINFNNIHNNRIIINGDINRTNKISGQDENNEINHKVMNFLKNINNNRNINYNNNKKKIIMIQI